MMGKVIELIEEMGLRVFDMLGMPEYIDKKMREYNEREQRYS